MIEFMRCNSLLEFAVGFVAHLYCAAYWLQSDATAWWPSIDDDFPRAWVHRG